MGLDIVPAAGGTGWANVSVAKGQTAPVLQGWYSPVYGEADPSAAATYLASVAAPAQAGGAVEATWAWVLVPTAGGRASGAAAAIRAANSTHAVVDVSPAAGAPEERFTIAL